MSSKVERKLAAIMFTDIAGYTALSAKDETKALELLDTQKQILTPIIEEFNGTLHKEIGDGLLFTFPMVTEAVKCGIKIQEETKVIDDLNLRIGIHEGEITLKDGDVLGDDVNVASRIETYAAAGGIAISGKIQQNILSLPEFETKFISQPSFKGVRQEVKVFCITSHGLPETDITKVTVKLEKDVKKIWFNQKLIIKTIAILSVLTFGIIYWITENNQTSKIIDKEIINQNKKHLDISYFSDTVLVNELIKDIKILDKYKVLWNASGDFDTSLTYSTVSDSVYSLINQEIVSNVISIFPYSQIITFNNLQQSFASQGKIIQRKNRVIDYYRDKDLPYGVGFGFYIYKIEAINAEIQYVLIFEYKNKRWNGFQTIIGNKEEIINEMVIAIENLLKREMKRHVVAEVNVIQDADLIISLKPGIPLRSGTILYGVRQYQEGYRKISDKGVQQRIKDLQELYDCFESVSVWQNTIKHYNWSFNEYDDLINKKFIKIGGDGAEEHSGIIIKVIEVYDTTASAVIIESHECINIKVGDLLYLK